MNKTELDKLQEEMTENMKKIKEQLMNIKIKKFERNNKDYLHNRV